MPQTFQQPHQQIFRLHQPGASTASAHNLFRGSTNIYSMEISLQSDTIELSVTSPSTVYRHSSVDQQVPVCTCQNHAVIISQAKAGDNNNSFQQLPDVAQTLCRNSSATSETSNTNQHQLPLSIANRQPKDCRNPQVVRS